MPGKVKRLAKKDNKKVKTLLSSWWFWDVVSQFLILEVVTQGLTHGVEHPAKNTFVKGANLIIHGTISNFDFTFN